MSKKITSLIVSICIIIFFIGSLLYTDKVEALRLTTVPQGGTGADSFTAGECLVGSGTGAITTQNCGIDSFIGTLGEIGDVSTTTLGYGSQLTWDTSNWVSTSTIYGFTEAWNTEYNSTTTLNGFTNNSTDWDIAYGWGDHSIAGYYVSADFATDWASTYNATSTLNGFTNNQANWNIAYGWGNHAGLYLLDSESDIMTGTLTADGLTIGANELITIGAQTLTHDGTNFVFNDTVAITGYASSTSGLNTQGTLHIGGNGLIQGTLGVTGAITGSLTGNASTATALAADGANCSTGEYPLGIDASGAVESCTDATTEINSVVNGLGGTNLTCSGQSCNVDDAFLVNNATDSTTGGLSMNSATTTDTLRIGGKATFAGNVGIGTTGPGGKLDVRDGSVLLSKTGFAHGITGVLPTTAFGSLASWNANGGFTVGGISDGTDAIPALYLGGIIGSADPTDTTPALLFRGSKKNDVQHQALAAAETVLKVQNYTTDLVTVLGNGNVGIGTTGPDGTLHVHTATAGSVAAAAEANDLVVENSGDGGITVLTPDANTAELVFGTPSDSTGAKIAWDYGAGGANQLLKVFTTTASGQIVFLAGAADEKMRITSTGNVGIGTTGPLVASVPVFGGEGVTILGSTVGTLELAASSDIDEAHGGRLSFVNTANSNAGASTRQLIAGISGAIETTDSNAGDDSGGHLIFYTKIEAGNTNQERMRITSTGNVGIGTTSPSQKLSVAGSVLADAYLEYSPAYVGDAVTAIKGIKAEKDTEQGNWAKIDHNTLPEGVRVESPATSTNQIGVEIIEHEAEYQDVFDEKTGTSTILIKEAWTEEKPIMEDTVYTFVGRDLGANVQLNTRAIQQLIERIETLEAEKSLGVGGDRILELKQELKEEIKREILEELSLWDLFKKWLGI